MCETISEINEMVNALENEPHDKDRFEMWLIDYKKLGICVCCVCELVDKQIYESYKLLKLYDKIADSNYRSSKLVIFGILKRMDDVSINHRKEQQKLVDDSNQNEIINNKHNNRLTLNNELERIRVSCHLDLLNNNIMHEYYVWLIGDEYDRPSYD
jgi:hypothetical protein